MLGTATAAGPYIFCKVVRLRKIDAVSERAAKTAASHHAWFRELVDGSCHDDSAGSERRIGVSNNKLIPRIGRSGTLKASSREGSLCP